MLQDESEAGFHVRYPVMVYTYAMPLAWSLRNDWLHHSGGARLIDCINCGRSLSGVPKQHIWYACNIYKLNHAIHSKPAWLLRNYHQPDDN